MPSPVLLLHSCLSVLNVKEIRTLPGNLHLACGGGGCILDGPSSAGTSGTWANTGSLNTARTDHTATFLPNGQVLVAGGYAGNLSGPIVLSCAELYTP
jgi:hypothetical protein